jgi:tRNA (guanine-N(7)-)-methyltransferase
MLGKNNSFTKVFCTRGRLIISKQIEGVLNKILLREKNSESQNDPQNDFQSNFQSDFQSDFQNELNFFINKFPETWIEIGFGTGDNIIHQLSHNSNIGMIGCDPFVNGAMKFCNKLISKTTLNMPNGATYTDRIKILTKPAGYLLEKLPNECVERVFVLFPDPWPKNKHNKRRIFSEGFLKEILRILKPNGSLCFASDNHKYAKEVMDLINSIEPTSRGEKFESVEKLEKYFDYLARTKYMMKAKDEPLCIEIKKILNKKIDNISSQN